ncbi:MAG: trypsin-like peptidase domain-containing protein [Myxococcota bacterium]|nr:trypsin-like peptidase domain-containing protein [Myxococcota bacterium]
MIRLHQTFGAHTGRVLELDRDVIRLGRLPDNEVSFDPHADLDASGRHAEIRREGPQWVLVDVGSRNGTLVRGQPVTRHVLASGDEIEFGVGGPRIRVELPGASRGPQMTAEATPVQAYATGPATPMGHSGDGFAAPSLPQMQHPTPPPSPFAGQPSPAPISAPGMTPQPISYPGQAPQSQPPPHGYPSPSAPSMPAATPGQGERRYGQRTVGMMIQAALQQADAQRQQGGNRSTAFIRAVAHEAAQSSSRGLKIAVVLLALLLLLTLGAVIAVFFYARWQEQELRDENVRLQHEIAQLGEGESAERQQLEQRIQSLNEQLSEEEAATGTTIAEQNDQAVWVLLSTRTGGQRSVVCSAFAVRPRVLATAAHCVGALEREMSRSREVRAVPNRGGDGLQIERMWRHPQYTADAPASPDVGLLRVSAPTSQQVQVADMGQLTGLRTGDDVFVLGFPAAIADEGAPAAGISTGVVGRLTAFDGSDPGNAALRHLVSHSAFSDEGTAGSPIFDRQGRVVAINAGNFRARRRVVDTQTRVTRTVESDTPYAWGVRADLLLQLLAGLPE